MAHSQGALVDLLDRVLDRGLVINADIIVSVAGVPLLGIQLRAALAGMETMAKYGLLRDWDRSIRELSATQTFRPSAAKVPFETVSQVSPLKDRK